MTSDNQIDLDALDVDIVQARDFWETIDLFWNDGRDIRGIARQVADLTDVPLRAARKLHAHHLMSFRKPEERLFHLVRVGGEIVTTAQPWHSLRGDIEDLDDILGLECHGKVPVKYKGEDLDLQRIA